ncbi:MAG: ABC transporter permease [Actinomycetota bacterium]|jgi:ribose/xylose/arabinose/galactoside ABC-type transport system permease subunit|nr:ABC transporter permease [Actinomycetota bacterium]
MTTNSTGSGFSLKKLNRYSSVIYTYIFLILVFAVFYIFFPIYRSSANLSNLLVQIAPLAIVAIGQGVVLIGGGVDLSIGSVISLTTVIAANLMGSSTGGILLGLIMIFAIAVLIGLVNGVICNETHIPPLIVTLSMSYVVQGIVLWYRNTPGGSVPRAFSSAILYRVGILSVPLVIVIIVYAFFMFLMHRSVFGLHTYAVGENETYARMAGVNVKKVRIGNYIISSILAAVAGLILASRIGSGAPLIGDPFTLDSLTGAIIGGMTFAGGEGFIIGSLGGAAIVGMMSNALNMSGVEPFYQYIFRGGLLILAMIINSFKRR